jgi:lysophospholipase L1-like esterase
MSDNRRDFLKKSLIGSAALTLSSSLFANPGQHTDNTSPKTILFQGDSITDGGRSFDADWNHVFGQGYVYLIASRMGYEYPAREYSFLNRGISGNKVTDLAARWQKDTLDVQPDLLSILIGVNDLFGVVVRGEKATADDFGHSYDTLLARTKKYLPNVVLVLCEPFILPVGMVLKNQNEWTNGLQKRQAIVKDLATQYDAIFVPLQTAFNKALRKAPANHWIWDGIHPMPSGHELIAKTWLKSVNKKLNLF